MARSAGFFKQPAEMGFDRGFGDAERGRDLRNAANVDNGAHHAQLGGRQIVGLADGFGMRAYHRCFTNEQGRRSRVCGAGVPACAGGQWQHMNDVVLAVVRGKRYGNAFGTDLRVAVAGGGQCVAQDLIDMGVAGGQPAAGQSQEIASVQNVFAGGVGMDEFAVGAS